MGRTALAASADNHPIAGVQGGTFAIYDHGPNINNPDDAPAISPRNHLDKIAVHSDLDYLGFEESVLVTGLAVPAGPTDPTAVATETHELHTHGLGYKPLIMSRFRLTGTQTWYAVNGETHISVSIGLIGQSIFVQCDDQKVYLYAAAYGAFAAVNVDVEFWIINRAFDNAGARTDEVLYADTNSVRAAGGVFDTNRNYLQGAGTETPTLNVRTGQTIKVRQGNVTGEKEFGISSSTVQHGAPSMTILPAPNPPGSDGAPAFNTVNQVGLIFNVPGSSAETLNLSPSGFRLAAANGDVKFDTSRQLVALTDEFTDTIDIPAHGSVDWTVEPSTVIHFDQVCHPDANLIFGWLEVTSASAKVLTHKAVDFSGSIDLWAVGYVAGSIFHRRAAVVLSPRIENGRMQVVEQSYCYSIGSQADPTPAISVRVHLFAAALTGGF